MAKKPSVDQQKLLLNWVYTVFFGFKMLVVCIVIFILEVCIVICIPFLGKDEDGELFLSVKET